MPPDAVFARPVEASDHDLLSAMRGDYGQLGAAASAAAGEWVRRYPEPATCSGWKTWRHEGDALAGALIDA